MVEAVKVPYKIRICIETRDLKKAIRREHFSMTTVEKVVAGMPQAKVFSVLDTTSGYWQVKLERFAHSIRHSEDTGSQGYHLE